MAKSRIFALIGNIIYTLLAFGSTLVGWTLLVLQHSKALDEELKKAGLDMQLLITAMIIAFSLILILMIFNWIAFARLDKGKGWRIYFLVLGIFYGLASTINSAGIIITLPIAICFILAFVFKRRELSEV
ncbi:hypothetical protein [Lactococcus protaetiae]|uniref:DUF4064 domain-containing protein n=1 Tax=Lactococcus protaetiae TaxID=2592653 RepID=A0A514ZAP7_9LACT|nr:hypothetical protein [Lactococcus protaetiae]MCL2112963.1 hypothetical protein [Streptococcaceae bacterium]QDK71645.1 hypothetical protein FLP15_11315 [Lactococcus protaetiae]